MAEPLRIGHLSTFYHTAFVLMGTDWLAEAGIDASWKLFPSGPDIMKAMTDGEIDLAYIGLPPAMIGISKEMQVKCIAGGHVEGTVLVARDRYLSIDELGDEKAVLAQFSVIGCPPKGSIHDIIIRDLLRRYQDLHCEVRNYAWADFALAALTDGEIPAAIGTPALAVGARRFACGKIVIPPHRLWPDNPSYGIVATNEAMKRENVVLSFLRAHERACTFIRDSPGDAAKIVARVTGIVDEQYVLDCYRVSPGYCAALSPEFIASTMRFAPVLRELGYMAKTLTEKDIFDRRFIGIVHPEPPHYDMPLA
ncbi:MAG TPA: ABC transporter substrate-binding protein [Methanocella sp.]|jgi:NitT/TauT family transport system substrate-binding protein